MWSCTLQNAYTFEDAHGYRRRCLSHGVDAVVLAAGGHVVLCFDIDDAREAKSAVSRAQVKCSIKGSLICVCWKRSARRRLKRAAPQGRQAV
jgi:hypothetical protein